MSILSLVAPIESVMPAAEGTLRTMALMLRTAGGLGALVAMITLFRPLFIGIWHALLITVKPRLTLEQRITQRRCQSAIMLNRLADQNSISQPNLASELRCFALRD